MAQRKVIWPDDEPRVMEAELAYVQPRPEPKAWTKVSPAYLRVKRTLDVLFAVVALAALSPLLTLVALVICLDDPHGSPIFVQDRVGKNGRIFRCYKYRSMDSGAPHECATRDFKDAGKHITRVGRLIRKSSIDELPQLYNVVKGDMSFVGPRPLIVSEEHSHKLRRLQGVYEARPGMTGLAQINGRDNMSPNSKVEFDAEYVRTMSFKNDLGILLKTLFYVARGEDVVEGSDEVAQRSRTGGK